MLDFSKDYPKTLQEFIDRGGEQYIAYRVSKFKLLDVINAKEDLVQSILLQMYETNYIESYDPSERDFLVYINVFVYNFLCRLYKKERKTRYGYCIVNRKSLEMTLPDNPSDMDGSVVYLESLFIDEGSEVDYKLLVDSIRGDLSVYKSSSSVEFEGKIYERSPLTVFELILQDKTVAEIAQILQTSKQFIYILLNKIRNTETLSSYIKDDKR